MNFTKLETVIAALDLLTPNAEGVLHIYREATVYGESFKQNVLGHGYSKKYNSFNFDGFEFSLGDVSDFTVLQDDGGFYIKFVEGGYLWTVE